MDIRYFDTQESLIESDDYLLWLTEDWTKYNYQYPGLLEVRYWVVLVRCYCCVTMHLNMVERNPCS